MKINERTILNKGCRICEQEYLSLFPALAVSYYSNKKGLKAELGSDRLLGVPLETYIPSEKLAIESGSADENIEIMKAYMCKQRGIRLIAVFKTVVYTNSSDSFKYYEFTDAENAAEFDAYVAKCKELSLYDTGVSAEYGDKLISLSTCEYSRNNGRLIVVAKKISE